MKIPSQYRSDVRRLISKHCTIVMSRSGHYKVYDHEGHYLFTFASTPNGGCRSYNNFKATVRRLGY